MSATMPSMARSIPHDIRASLAAPLGRLARLGPFELLHKSNAALDELLTAQAHIGSLRRAAVRDLRAQGYTLKEIADEIGVKPQRIHQIEHGYDRAEKRERAQRS